MHLVEQNKDARENLEEARQENRDFAPLEEKWRNCLRSWKLGIRKSKSVANAEWFSYFHGNRNNLPLANLLSSYDIFKQSGKFATYFYIYV